MRGKITSKLAPRLFSPLALGELQLSHRVVMAPLTRMRSAQPGNIPQAMNVEYYSQRVTEGGLIITEATQISSEGQGYPATPGIHSEEQVAGWRKVVEAVHARGGLLVLQLWHVGRISHSSLRADRSLPVAPSAVPAAGQAFTANFQRAAFETPHALSVDEIERVINDYKAAAQNARRAGFDGVEIHGANGYLIDQFLRDKSNLRDDEYGGSIANRIRFLREVVSAVVDVWGSQRVGIRLSPFGTVNDMADTHPFDLFSVAISEIDKFDLAYLHLIEPRQDEMFGADMSRWAATPIATVFRRYFSGPIVAAGGYEGDSAEAAIRDGHADAVAFGRWFISNPDLATRIALGQPFNAYDRETFYGGSTTGYTDYPFSVQHSQQQLHGAIKKQNFIKTKA
jgi:N-ethylmaleimide reductase